MRFEVTETDDERTRPMDIDLADVSRTEMLPRGDGHGSLTVVLRNGETLTLTGGEVERFESALRDYRKESGS